MKKSEKLSVLITATHLFCFSSLSLPKKREKRICQDGKEKAIGIPMLNHWCLNFSDITILHQGPSVLFQSAFQYQAEISGQLLPA